MRAEPPQRDALAKRRGRGTPREFAPPLTSLEPLESNPQPADPHIAHPRFGKAEYDDTPPITRRESAFRHSGWAARRRVTYRRLIAAGQSDRRQRAFADCGAYAAVLLNAEKTEYRVVCQCCHDRLCLACASARSARISSALAAHVKSRTTRFVTLTQRASETPLADQITNIYRDFANLRRRNWWKENVFGGAAFLEVKIGANSGLWHVHLHVLVESKFIDQRTLSSEWHAVTGASYIVDVRAVPDADFRARYVTKYVTKPMTTEVLDDEKRCVEFILAIRGRRLCLTFGTWRGIDLDPDDPDTQEWTRVGSLDDLLKLASEGYPPAVRIIEALTRKKEPECPNST